MRDFGGVIPTLAYFRLEVLTSDSSRGGVTGGGTYTSVDPHTISATAAEGYRFTHWNDGGSDNPRQVWLMSDTVFTAYFVERGQVWAEVSSNDVDLGTVTGGGAYYEGDTATLLALPQPYNKFLCWDDSVCDNPRQVVVTQDTAFTAVFAPLERYVVEAVANNSDRGRVTGGGEYYEGDTVTLTALPWTSFGFLQWDDGDTSNPRHFVLTQDTVFTAVFVSRNGIEKPSADGTGFQLQPNPAREQVAVTLAEGAADVTVLTVADAAGREVLRKELAQDTRRYVFSVADLPAGTYFVTLTTPAGTSTKKLMVE